MKLLKRSEYIFLSDNNFITSFLLCFQESYVKEVSEDKVNMLLVNKADLLTREQRRVWARHFEKEGLRAVFWSALAENNRLEAEDKVRGWRFDELLNECFNTCTLRSLTLGRSTLLFQGEAEVFVMYFQIVLRNPCEVLFSIFGLVDPELKWQISLTTGHGSGGFGVWRE